MLVQLERYKDEIRAAGFKNVAVGIGEPKHAANFCGKLAPGLTCLVNKTTQTHKAYGLKRAGLSTLLDPRLYANSARATAAGLTQGQTTGDVAMLGGVFVIDQQGVVRYAYANDVAGDYPEIPDILKALPRANT
jgi:peroxiredoxin